MSIRDLLLLLTAGLVATGCASPMICDPNEVEPYMTARSGTPLEGEEDAEENSRYQIPGEERAARSRANPCLAQAPRIIEPPISLEREQREGTAFADLRYRLELVEDERFPEQAQASTLRLRLGGTTPSWRGFDAGVAFQTTQVAGVPRYEDTTDLPGNFPTVRDPEDTITSEGWGRYVSREGMFRLTAGRQPMSHANERFIGTDSFRQLEQTFNGTSMQIGTGETAHFKLDYINQANRVVGPNHPDPFLAQADLDGLALDLERRFGDTRIGLYGHNLRFDDARQSHRNYGIRFTGRLPWTERFEYRLELAEQKGISDEGPSDPLGYHHIRLAQNLEGWSWELGTERLGGNRTSAVQTPLGSLHDFNGWADRFRQTPAFGLRDQYAGLSLRQAGWEFTSRYHDFQVDNGSGRYGQELSLSASRPVFGQLQLHIGVSRYAGAEPTYYDGDAFADDTTRAWMSISANFQP